ncbi:MAG: helix-hairpin-helix domain-containing protein [Pseudomonadota bacterium]
MKAQLRYLILGLFLLFAAPALLAEVVNINKADAETLQQHLQGIGPVKSKAIVDYRKKHGAFKNLDELLKVEGMGPGILKKNKKNLSLTKGVSKTTAKDKPHSDKKAADTSSPKDKKKSVSSSKKAKEPTKSKDKSKSTKKKETAKEKKTSKKTSDSKKSTAKKSSTSHTNEKK